jgi:DNA-binding SARP family transcriptional activator
MAPPLEIRVLGELELTRGGKPLVLPASKKTRALLGYLVVVRTRAQPRQRLCELFWDGPDDPRAALRWSLSKLRPFVDDAKATRLVADRDHVVFDPRGAEIDLATVAERLGPAAQAPTEALTDAAGLYRGELLEGLDLPDCHRYHEWCIAEREAARRTRGAILAALIDRFVSEPEKALRFARMRVAIDPLVESAHVSVMKILAQIGRPREAMKQYESCRRILLAQLGREPSKEVELTRLGLGSRPAVAAPPAVAASPAGTAPESAALPHVARDAHPAPASERWAPGSSSQLRLVGRAPERAAFADALRAAQSATSPPVLLVSGEPGIGKTRLLADLAHQTAALGGTALGGRAFEAEMIRPYGVWIDVLRSAALGALNEALRADLAPLLPELGAPPGEADRNRLFDGVRRLLLKNADDAPVVVLIDDIQWLDEASSALLHYLARSLSPSRVLFALAARPAEVTANRPVQALLQALVRAGRLARIELGPLDEAATRELVEGVDHGLDAKQIFADGGGNPLFSLELARAAAHDAGPVPTPSLDRLIAERLSRLDERATDLLPWAAALGHSFSVDTLASLTSLPPGDLLGALEELERYGVFRVVAAEAGSSGYDFAHDLVRRAAYRSMSEPRRRWVHRQVARTLSAADDPESILASDIAHHAALGGDNDAASRAYVAAGERCLRLFAHADASRLATRGLQHVDQLPPETAIRRRLALLSIQAHSNQWLSRAHELEGAIARAAALAAQRGMHAEASRAYYLISFVHSERGDFAAAGARTLQAVALAGQASDLDTRQHQLANTGRCLVLIERHIARAEAFLLEAEHLCATPAGPTRMEIAFGRGLLSAFVGKDDEAVALLERAAELAAEADPWARASALMRVARVDLERGRPRDVLARCAELEPLVSKLTEGSVAPFVSALQALARIELGEADGHAAAENAIANLRAADSKGQLAYVLNAVAGHDAIGGRSEAARRRSVEALRAAETVGQQSEAAVARARLAGLAHARGDRTEAADWLKACAANPTELSARARVAVDGAVRAVSVSGDRGAAP